MNVNTTCFAEFWDVNNFNSSDILSHLFGVTNQHIKQMGDVDINLCLEPQSIRGPGESKTIINRIHGTGIFAYIYHKTSTKCI